MKSFLYQFVLSPLLFVTLLGLFVIPSKIHSAQLWNKFPNNPVINPINSQLIHIFNPSIFRKNNTYFALFQVNNGSGWKLSLGNSQTLENNWQLSNQTPIALGQWDIEHANPTVLFNPILNQYQAWYSGYSHNVMSGSNRFKLGYATSLDGINWNKYSTSNDKWVLLGDSNSWDEGGIARGNSIIFLNGKYHLWYTATNTQTIGSYWRIGYATSLDGINWIKYQNNPVIQKTENWEYSNMMYPFVLYEDGKFKMWYGTGSFDSCSAYAYAESLNGYDWVKPTNKNPVYVVPSSTGTFDSVALAGHTRIREENEYKILYSGFDGTHWSIGYATASADPVSTPTPTPLEPVVIVPGMMASWNKAGILEGQTNPTTSWKLLPFVKEYEGLIHTLKNLGYVEGKNLFVWPYDWRKSISTITQKLDEYIQSTVKVNNPNSKIHLVGHSLGGLVTRSWTQTNNNIDTIHHIINVATPEKGTIQPYKAWSGGDISQDNNFLSLAGKMMLELNRRSFGTSREVIQTTVPSFKDILPTEPYLKQQNDVLISISDMKLKNSWLMDLNMQSASVSGILSVIRGVGFSSTPNIYKIESPLWLDQALGNWQDGKPVSTEFSDGDSVIPSSRSSLDTHAIDVSLSHANSIAAKNGIKTILDSLEIPATDSAITEGKETTIQPGLLFLLRSPATIQVVFNGTTYTDFDGIIFIPNAQNGIYEVTVIGTGTGIYRLAVGQFTNTLYSWKEYTGETTSGKRTSYSIQFNASAPADDPVINFSDEERLKQIDLQLVTLSTYTANTLVPKIRYKLTLGVSALTKKDFPSLKNYLEQIVLDLSALRKTNLSSNARSQSFVVFDTLIDAYQAILMKKQYVINQSALLRLQTVCESEYARINSLLSNQYTQGNANLQKVQLLQEAQLYKNRADKTGVSEKPKKYILLYITQALLREIGL